MAEMPLFERLQDEDHDGEERVFRVSEVNRAVRAQLEDGWGSVLIEGELSDVRRSQQGHVYFSLNDEEEPAQLRGVMFRSDVGRTKAPLEDGARILFRGKLSLYQARGQFQLIARSAKLAGEGDLAAQFRKLRAKLEAEGLLDPGRKRPLPELPRVVGVVTSRTGAALRDIMRVAAERCPVHILVADCRVQGEAAPASIVQALELVQRVEDLDVVIVSRGGGSAEDLWAFNDEGVARAIATCRVPVVSGVGHEVDVTIADLVADVRAATPSNAAEIVVPEREALLREVQSLERRLSQAFDNRIGGLRLRLERLLRPLYGARRVITPVRRELASLDERLLQAQRSAQRARREALVSLQQRLIRLDPRSVLRRDRRDLSALGARLRDAGRLPIRKRREQLLTLRVELQSRGRPMIRERRAAFAEACTHLDALSPLRVLERGYAIALHEETGRAVRSRSEVNEGDRLRVRVSDGEFGARVEDHE
jgi:exodeoxyribonuclease VII large subunit